MSPRYPSGWPVLFDIAIRIFSQFEERHGFTPGWSFGGGTALMLQIDHRDSHDVDLFLDDAQLLPLLNPETQGVELERQPDSYTSETSVLKLAYKDLGEIDFICCASLVEAPTQKREVRGRLVALETPAEIIAKKIWYRGWNFQPRDMFDLAAVVEHCGSDYVASALRQCGRARCATALAVVEKAAPTFVEAVNRQLMVRESTRHLIARAQEVSRSALMSVLSDSGPNPC